MHNLKYFDQLHMLTSSSRDFYMHKLMYFDQLHKETPINSSINVLETRFQRPSQVLELFSTTRNDHFFLFSRALRETFMCINLCISINYTSKYPKIAVLMSSKKVFWVGFRFSNFFRVLETNKFFFFQGSSEDFYMHKLMYFDQLHKEISKNSSTNVL